MANSNVANELVYSKSVPEIVDSLKETLRKKFGSKAEFPHLRSLFLIGSLARSSKDPDDWYQDLDVHLLVDKVTLEEHELNLIRTKLDAIRSEFENSSTKIDYVLRDRHWKLPPDPTRRLNLSIHPTLLNRLDYQRRICHSPVLAFNMYRICEVLLGDHPGTILPLRRPSPLEHIYSVGGTAWMIENFYRALWMHFVSPTEQKFYPYMTGYCWNVASSVMLQSYTVGTGNVATRSQALAYLRSDSTMPTYLRSDLELLVDHKFDSAASARTIEEVVNSTGRLTNWIIKTVQEKMGLSYRAPPMALGERDLHSSLLSKLLGREIELREVDVFVDAKTEDIYGCIKDLVRETSESFPNANSQELFEFLSWVLEHEMSEATKTYVWSETNWPRFLWSHDFDFHREEPSLRSALWGWENGSQALLQRLHETYISSGDNHLNNLLAKAAVAISNKQLRSIGLEFSFAQPRDFFDSCRALAAPCLNDTVL